MADGTGPKKKKRKPGTRETRVAIGPVFTQWRKIKVAKGYGSDAEMARDLLHIMNATAASPTAANKKIRCSQMEVQTLIEQEVHTAVQGRERKLQALIENIQQLDCAEDYESSIQKLEAQITKVTRRAEAAIAFMTKSPTPSGVQMQTNRADSEGDAAEVPPQPDKKSECRKLVKIMVNTKKALNKLQVDNKALKVEIADSSEEKPPQVLAPKGKENAKSIKTEQRIKRETQSVENKPEEPKQMEETEWEGAEQWEEPNKKEGPKQGEEPQASPVKVEFLPLRESCSPEGRVSDKVAEKVSENVCEKGYKLLYPPLPPNNFPTNLKILAASYNIPHRLQVRLALIRNPAGLSVLWNVEEEDPFGPPMGSYSVFMTVEKVKDSNVFPEWTRAEVEAKPLPMCMMISKYKPGRKVCVAVVGRDAFGRYGPYSKVVTAYLPD